MDRNYTCSISYGKLRVPVYRVYAQPLIGVTPIPESRFTGRPNTLFALEVDVEVFGSNFLPSYTRGDNSNVVATDSMKNFVLRQALAFKGSTIEAFLALLGKRFLGTYEQIEGLRLTARELPFTAVTLPGPTEKMPQSIEKITALKDDFLPLSASTGAVSEQSAVLFSRSHNDFALATMDFTRDAMLQAVITSHRSGRRDLELFKVTGSAFTHFVRDEYTTLPERVDRPLFIYLDVYWTYTSPSVLPDSDHSLYVPSEQVRDLLQVVFDSFVSESIQHLVYEMGCRLLERFPQLASVSFEAQNRTRDLVVAEEEEKREKVYTDPFSAYGTIKLTLDRSTESEKKEPEQ